MTNDAKNLSSTHIQGFLSFQTSESLMDQDGEVDSFLQPESLASLRVEPGSREARMMTAGSGRKLCGLFRKQDPLGAFSRILLESETWGSQEYLLTWKLKRTKCGSLVFQLAPSMPRTSGTGIGSWQTPSVVDQTGRQYQYVGKNRDKFLCLPGQVKSIRERKEGESDEAYWERMNKEDPVPTVDQVKATWPTPREGKTTAEEMESWQKRKDAGKVATPPLGAVVKATWPTLSGAGGGQKCRGPGREDELLVQGILRATWPTPQGYDGKRGGPTTPQKAKEGNHGMVLTNYCPTSGTTPSGSLALTEKFVERLTTLSAWLMGYTVAYLQGWETASSRKSRLKS